jgi:tetratricopeptide (TPR) repeat protein
VTQASEKTTKPQSAADWHRQGNALLDDGKIDRAISAYRRALRIDDAQAEAHNDLGTAYFQKGWHAEAEKCFRRAIALEPGHGIAQANLGAALRAQGRLSDSRQAFQRALLLKIRNLLPRFLRWRVNDPVPRPQAPDGEALDALRQQLKAISEAVLSGRGADALEAAQAAEARHPGNPDVVHMHAMSLEVCGKLEEALEKVGAAIGLKPDRTEYHITRARILVRAWRPDEALRAAAEALRLEPGSAVVLATIAGIYHPWRDDLAVQVGERAVAIDPACDLAHGNLASALWGLSRLDEAEEHAREAVRLNPGQLTFRANLALVLKDQGRIEEAQQMYRGMVDDAPRYPKICMDMGTLALECEGDIGAARQWYRKAQLLDHPRAYLSEAVLNLLDGRFEPGWTQYEARKKVLDQRAQQEPFERFTPWQGEAMDSGTLLVYGEQGLGDEIMFASMYEELGKRVRNVRLLCDVRLAAIFRRSFPSFEVVGAPREKFAGLAAAMQGVDRAVAAGSLGQYFRRCAQDFPGRPYLRSEPDKVAQWKDKLATLGDGRRVGISWMGGMQRTGRSRRSLAPAQLEPLLALPGIRWVSLQHNDDGSEPSIHRFPGVTRDMDELASLIGALDLVVSVCNTNVHVAGAIGKEALVMAPFVPEWRYGMAGERMVWYAQARVFRQARYGEWDGVVARVRAALTGG